MTDETRSSSSPLPTAYLIEADPHYLITMTRLLRDAGYNVRRNTNGIGVLGQLEDAEPAPALIVLSIDLGVCRPVELARGIRYLPALAAVPLVGVGDPALFVRDRLLDERFLFYFDAFLPKPVPRQRFAALLEEFAQPQTAAARA